MASFVFPKVDITPPERSNRDLSLTKRTSFAAGPLYPILIKDILPGDRFKIKLDALIESFPMIAPALGSWKASFDFYFEPWSNLYGFMDNNRKLNTRNIINANRHRFSFGGDNSFLRSSIDVDYLESQYCRPSSIFDYLGVPPGFLGEVLESKDDDGNYTATIKPVEFPAEGLLSYVDIVRSYYVNNQENRAVYMIDPSSYTPNIASTSKSLADFDNIFAGLRYMQDGIVINSSDAANDPEYDVMTFFNEYVSNTNAPLGGLFLRTYKMDLNRGIMSTDVGNFKSVVNVEDGQFSIDTLRFANKLQMLIDRIDLSGGRFTDWIRTRWGVTPRSTVDEPIYLGSFSQVIHQTDVIAQSAGTSSTAVDANSNNPSSVLGQQAGFTVGSFNGKKQRPIVLNATEYGTLVCIFSLVPYVDYSQGIEMDMLKTKFADIYDPAMSRLGYQDVSRFELSVFPTFSSAVSSQDCSLLRDADSSDSVGKRIAWSEYMASLNRNHGDFSFGSSLDYWVFNRLYTTDKYFPESDEIPTGFMVRYGDFNATTYVYPWLWNRLFADTSTTAQNFRLQVHFDIQAKRPIGKRLMPHL